MTAEVIRLREGDPGAAALTALDRHLDRAPVAELTAAAYRRQARAYLAWLAERTGAHPDAWADRIGAEGAVAAWRRSLLQAGRSPSTVNQALAAVRLLYDQIGISITVKAARVPRPGEPDALSPAQAGALERAARRRGARDAAIIAVLLYAGARAAECAQLCVDDVAITARTGQVRLLGKGDQPRTVPLPAPARERLHAWLAERGRDPGPLWTGQRGPLTTEGVTQVVLAAGRDAAIPGLRPHRLRHSYATRLRRGGADPAQIQRLLGHASQETSARYWRAGTSEVSGLVDDVFAGPR